MTTSESTFLHHYRLVERIGQGGMGVVWKAVDSKLQREVAIKLLPAQWLEDASYLERFRREAQTLAALDHPNIVVIHAVHDEGPQPYMVMELVRGRPLSRVIQKNGLQLHELLDYAIPVADALAAAHAAGVTHRDLKPDNIMVTNDGRVKVLDFGLAKRDAAPGGAAADEKDTALTAEGKIIGTPHYMSPEQLRGYTVSTRSDVFAFGTLLYEMALGSRPFSGATLVEIAASILKDDPLPPTRLRSELPSEFDTIVSGCLERDPSRRIDAAAVREALGSLRRDLGNAALRTLAAAEPEPGAASSTQPLPESLAVVPFMDLSAEGDQGYFCIGVAEDIATALARVEGLKVTAASRIDRSTMDALELGRMLGVTAVLDGSVRRSGERMRVTARLVDVADGSQRWSARFDRSVADVFAVQDEVAEAVASNFRMQPPKHERPARRVDPEAYSAYLRGRYFWGKRYEGGLQRALECFADALAIDPDLALAHVGRADCFTILGHYGYMPAPDAYGLARQAATRALEIAPDLAEAHTTMGWIAAFFDWDRTEAARRFDRALASDPNYATGWEWLGIFLLSGDRYEDGLEAMSKARRLDPLSPMISTMLAWGRYVARDYGEAERLVHHVLDMDPRFVFAHNILAVIQLANGDRDGAVATMERGVALSNREGLSLAILGHAYGRAGRIDACEGVLREMGDAATRRHVSPLHQALVLLGAGRIDEAIERIEAAVAGRDSFLATIHFTQVLDDLRGRPRFEAAIRPIRDVSR